MKSGIKYIYSLRLRLLENETLLRQRSNSRNCRPISTTNTYSPKELEFKKWLVDNGYNNQNVTEGFYLIKKGNALAFLHDINNRSQRKRGRKRKNVELNPNPSPDSSFEKKYIILLRRDIAMRLWIFGAASTVLVTFCLN